MEVRSTPVFAGQGRLKPEKRDLALMGGAGILGMVKHLKGQLVVLVLEVSVGRSPVVSAAGIRLFGRQRKSPVFDGSSPVLSLGDELGGELLARGCGLEDRCLQQESEKGN